MKRRPVPLSQRRQKAMRIRYLLLDVDGVMTDGTLYFDENGREIKGFSIYDGHGIRLLQRARIGVGIISGRSSAVVAWRAKELGIEDVHQGSRDKEAAYEMIKAKHRLQDEAVAFIGDDLIDLSLLRRVGFSIAVASAVDAVKQEVDWVTKKRGGEGAIREVIDFILSVQASKKTKHEREKTEGGKENDAFFLPHTPPA
ncbi:MAG: HAD hydrolase family protein [Candidatus Manganitrophus sp. SB1]|nr:HAD hydrolase family protein [Candidatus Manganitrophus morganii]